MTFEEKLLELAISDDRIIVMTAENRAAIRNLPSKIGDRFIDVGIAEQTMIGAAAGLALRGRVPFVHALATFLTLRAFEFVRTDVGIGQLPVILVGGVPGFLSEANGPTHQAVEDISLMRGIPNMGVFCPADATELVDALPQIVASGKPFYIRYNACAPAAEHRMPFDLGKAEIYPSNAAADVADDITILTYGFLLGEALKAQTLLQADGFSTRIINMRTLSPIDENIIIDAADNSELLVTLEDHFQVGGLYSIVSEIIVREGVLSNVMSISLENRWFKPALLPDVLDYEGFTGEKIAERIRKRIAEDETMDDELFEDFYSLN
ncbi:MAG TPA: transketolase C-terminal domain-containing protein [Candidatus Kapabacteria bacterium]|nr:transketolase C-terminal domain-containing protein [Candidatus Kapabacteria bacterium]